MCVCVNLCTKFIYTLLLNLIIKFNKNITSYKKLIQFYKDNDIEINEEHGYYGTNLKSFAMIENEDVVGAVTISKYDSKNFIEVNSLKHLPLIFNPA